MQCMIYVKTWWNRCVMDGEGMWDFAKYFASGQDRWLQDIGSSFKSGKEMGEKEC
jgi:hypothetical protein